MTDMFYTRVTKVGGNQAFVLAKMHFCVLGKGFVGTGLRMAKKPMNPTATNQASKREQWTSKKNSHFPLTLSGICVRLSVPAAGGKCWLLLSAVE